MDGVSGVDLATVLFDLEPNPAKPAEDLSPWRPQPEPSQAQLVAAGVRGMVNQTVSLASRAVSAATRPATTLNALKDAAEGVGEIAWAGLNPAPHTPLNVEIGPHRRYAVVRQQLADYKEVKNALGGTDNDVVLSVVSGALASWLHLARGPHRGPGDAGAGPRVGQAPTTSAARSDNQLTVMRGPLPVYITHPEARLKFVSHAMDGLKESKQAVGAATLTAVNNLAPPTILAQASRLNFSTRLFNLLVTNIPGPQVPPVPARAKARGPVPGRVPAREPRGSQRSRSCPTTAGWTTACSATTTRCPTSRWSLRGSTRRCRSCSRSPGASQARSRKRRGAVAVALGDRSRQDRGDGGRRAGGLSPARGLLAGAREPVLPLPTTRAKTGPAADMRAKQQPAAPAVSAEDLKSMPSRGSASARGRAWSQWLPAWSTATV